MKARVPEETLDNYPKVGVNKDSKPMRDLKEAVAKIATSTRCESPEGL